MTNANFSHQHSMLNRQLIRPVTVLGAGSVGSYVVLALAKAGVSDITVFDHDVVKSHNVPMSLYRTSDVGRKKVDALSERITGETGVRITALCEKYRDQRLKQCSLIMCIDEMDQSGCGRIPIWNSIKGSLLVDVLIDTRINAWFGEVYTIVPTHASDVDNYSATLKPDAEMEMQTCGNHGIASMSMAVAGDAVNCLFRYWNTGAHSWRYARRYDMLLAV